MKAFLTATMITLLSFNLHATTNSTITAGKYGRSLPPEIMALINKVFQEHCPGALARVKQSPEQPYVSFVDSYKSYDVEVVYDSRYPQDMVAQFLFEYQRGEKLPTKILINDAYDTSHCDIGWHDVQ